jgi:catechol 2,3-dioxygenase-like lactoylglutathione lyase family enzyme
MSRSPCQIIVAIRGLGAAILTLACASGCVFQPGPAAGRTVPATERDATAFATARQTVRGAFPAVYQTTQRAIITVGRRQFACDGFLTASPAEGWHLALISLLGLVTDVRVRNDGTAEVLKVTPLFRQDWAREYVAPELRWLFTPPPELAPAGRLGDGRLALEVESRAGGAKARYVCSADGSRWEELDVWNGPRRLFHATVSGYRSFPGWPRAIPAEIELDAGAHQLSVRTVAVVAAASPTEEAP